MSQEPTPHPVRIEVAPDALSADLVVAAGSPAPDKAAISALMKEARIEMNPAVFDAIDQAVAAITALHGGPARITLARGTPPQHARPGHIAFEPGFDPDEVKRALAKAGSGTAAGRPPGSVDHYTRSVFSPVRVGTHVGTIIYPSQGCPGRDVFGNTLPPTGEATLNFTVDDTLKKGDDGTLIAMRPGVLEWGPGGLHVTDTLAIPATIDFGIGHVDFPGTVTVQGGVRDCFKVIARQDLVIEGVIEAATIKAGRDAHLRGGMAAKEKGSLDIGRDANVKYLNNATVSVGRDLNVEREAVNCRTSVGRNFTGPNCGIAGGSLAAACVVEVHTLGSEMGVATELRLGSIPALDSVLKEALTLMPLLEARRAKHLDPLEQLRAVKGRHAPSTLQRMAELEKSVEAVNLKIDPLQQRIDMLRATMRQRTAIDLLVHSRIYPKVILTAGNFTIDFIKELRGPLRIKLDDFFVPILCTLDGNPSGNLTDYAKVRRIDLTAGANAGSRAA